MKKYFASFLVSAAFVLVHSIPGAAEGSVVVDRVVAVVNQDIITMSDLQREAQKDHDGKPADNKLILEDMIDRKLQMAAAKKSGMDVTDKELNDAVADIMKRNNMDAARFEAALAKEGLSLEQYRAELREQMTLSRVFNKYVRTGLTVNDKEIREYYDKNGGEFSLPEEIRVRQIFIKFPDRPAAAQTAELTAKAQAADERARKGENFILLVREFSPAEVAALDGDLGFVQRDHLLPEMERAARDLKPGDIAGPLKTASGLHIIRMEEIRRPVQPFEKVRDQIADLLFRQKMENTYQAWLQTLRGDAHIENRL